MWNLLFLSIVNGTALLTSGGSYATEAKCRQWGEAAYFAAVAKAPESAGKLWFACTPGVEKEGTPIITQ